MSDDGGKSPQEGTGDVVQALQKQLPSFIQTILGQYGPAAEAEVGVARQYSPQIAQIQADVLANQGKQLAKTGREISRDEALAAAETEADIAAGAGQKTTAATLGAAQMLDPEYYASRKVLGDSISKLLDFDPTKLSKGEEEQIARGIGRTSTFVPSAAETAKNAVIFGDAVQKRRDAYGSAITQAANASSALRGPVSAAETTSRRTVLPNVGTAAYTGIQTPGVQVANQAGANLGNTATTAMNINMQKELSDWDKYLKGVQAVGNTVGVVGQVAGMAAGMCWVARAVYGETDSRWLTFRRWLLTEAPAWFQNLYRSHGPWYATWVKRSRGLRAVTKFFMDLVVNR